MKKAILITGILVLLLTLSCNKSHVCGCTTIVVDGNVSTDLPKQDTVINDMSKSDAIATCNAKDRFTNIGNVKTTKNCEIK